MLYPRDLVSSARAATWSPAPTCRAQSRSSRQQPARSLSPSAACTRAAPQPVRRRARPQALGQPSSSRARRRRAPRTRRREQRAEERGARARHSAAAVSTHAMHRSSRCVSRRKISLSSSGSSTRDIDHDHSPRPRRLAPRPAAAHGGGRRAPARPRRRRRPRRQAAALAHARPAAAGAAGAAAAARAARRSAATRRRRSRSRPTRWRRTATPTPSTRASATSSSASSTAAARARRPEAAARGGARLPAARRGGAAADAGDVRHARLARRRGGALRPRRPVLPRRPPPRRLARRADVQLADQRVRQGGRREARGVGGQVDAAALAAPHPRHLQLAARRRGARGQPHPRRRGADDVEMADDVRARARARNSSAQFFGAILRPRNSGAIRRSSPDRSPVRRRGCRPTCGRTRSSFRRRRATARWATPSSVCARCRRETSRRTPSRGRR